MGDESGTYGAKSGLRRKLRETTFRERSETNFVNEVSHQREAINVSEANH